MYAAGRSERRRATGCKGEADEALARDGKRDFFLRRELHNAALAGVRGRHIEVAVDVESEALRSSEATVEHFNRSMRVDAEDGVEAGCCWSGDIQVLVRAESEMIGRNTGFDRGENVDL